MKENDAGTQGADLQVFLACVSALIRTACIETGGWSGGFKPYRACSRKMYRATMADVMIYMGQRGLQGLGEGYATECERDMARPGLASSFSLTVRDILSANPSELMRRFTEGMDRLFEGTSISPMTVWSPSIAISETNGQIKVLAELPGLNKDDVRVELTQDGLTISGQRQRSQNDRHEGMDWSERFCRSFMRVIPIPNETQVEKMKATFENEILTVLVPVQRSGQPHQLSARVWADLERAEGLN